MNNPFHDPIDNQCRDRLGNLLEDGDMLIVVSGREKGTIYEHNAVWHHSCSPYGDGDVVKDSEKLTDDEIAELIPVLQAWIAAQAQESK